MSDNEKPQAQPNRCQLSLDRGDFHLRIDIDLPRQGVVGVFGPSGSGKTSLLRCIAGLEPTARGHLVVAGHTWMNDQQKLHVAPWKRRLGYVFQEPRLFAHLSVAGNLRFAMKRNHTDEDEFARVVNLLGLSPLLRRHTRDLSGGEQQRVAIGRALLRAPQMLLMDEPLAALDSARKAEILPYLTRLEATLALPVIYVSHNLDELIALCDTLVVLAHGQVIASGELATVLALPDIEPLRDQEASSVMTARVAEYDAGDRLTRLDINGESLWVPGQVGTMDETVRVRVFARDVSLCLTRPTDTSILNLLAARVTDVRDARGANVDVVLSVAAGTLIARITRRSAAALNLAPGLRLYAQIKTMAVRI